MVHRSGSSRERLSGSGKPVSSTGNATLASDTPVRSRSTRTSLGPRPVRGGCTWNANSGGSGRADHGWRSLAGGYTAGRPLTSGNSLNRSGERLAGPVVVRILIGARVDGSIPPARGAHGRAPSGRMPDSGQHCALLHRVRVRSRGGARPDRRGVVAVRARQPDGAYRHGADTAVSGCSPAHGST